MLVPLNSGVDGVFDKGFYHYGEVAAYRASKLLGLRLVPPTVYRKIEGVQGSLQFYIKAPKIRSISSPEQLTAKVGRKALSDMQLFYYVLGQWDTHAGNQLIASYGNKHYLALIDNSLMVHRTYDKYGGPTFSEKGRSEEAYSPLGGEFPYNKVKVIPGSEVKQVFKPYIGSYGIKRLSRHERVGYVIWNHRLWLRLDRKKFRFTKRFYQSTLDAFEALDEESLHYAWAGMATYSPKRTRDLVKLTLQRRDEILRYVANKGKIY